MSAEQRMIANIMPGKLLPEGEELKRNIARRRRRGMVLRSVLFICTIVGIIALALLIYNIVDESTGLIAVQSRAQLDAIVERPVEDVSDLSQEEMIAAIREYTSGPILRRLERAQPLEERSEEELQDLVRQEVLKETVVASYPLHEMLFNRSEIEAEVAEEYPNAELRFYSWVNREFLVKPMASTPAFAGVRTAILGSLYMVLVTMLVAIPLGISAAIYLEEYATDNWLNRIIQSNINNLAGVPSIIYGLLGLAIFVRALEYFTSGAAFGQSAGNGRTIISASLTMALLILPLIIINAQEAIRAVPQSLRQGSLALGATQWQTIWNHVLPYALPGILTGTIFGTARALGEAAPLIVIGASTFIVTDPTGPFSKFTALPIQIFNWARQPQEQFQDISAAAIVVLLVILILLNSAAVILRNRFSKRM